MAVIAWICRMDIVFLIVFTIQAATAERQFTEVQTSFVKMFNDHHGNEKPELELDKAWLTLNSTYYFDVMVYAHNQECWKCGMQYVVTARAGKPFTMIINATYGTDVELRRADNTSEIICRFSAKFKEYGDYWLFLDQSSLTKKSCDILISNDPMVAEMPILYAAIGLLGLLILKVIIVHVYKYCRKRKLETESYSMNGAQSSGTTGIGMMSLGSDTEQSDTTQTKRKRLKSLDTFRGLSLIVMVFVNYGGGGYWFLEHPPWNGLTIADLVFPWFVFMMGVSMNFSFRGMLKRGKSRWKILWKVVRRACLLFAFGIMLNTNWGPVKLDNVRIPGVLQRLSLSYLVTALLETAFARKEDTDPSKKQTCSWLRDIVLYIPEWIINLLLLGTYVGLTYALPVPGCPTGYIGPGGLHDGKQYENCTGGAAGYIDRLVLGDRHLYNNPTPKKIYQTVVPYDPEGIMGTLAAVFLCFLGLQAGRIFMTYKDHNGRLIRLLVWAVATGAIGAGLCQCSKNDGIVPLNKNLWSVSFMLVTASFGYIILGVMYIFIDILEWWSGSPFIYPGMNSLVVFLCHDIFYRMFPINWVIGRVHWKLLLKALWDVTIWVTLAFVLYCKKIFIAL